MNDYAKMHTGKFGKVRQDAVGDGKDNKLPPLPPCKCGAAAVTQVRTPNYPVDRHYICATCYERIRPLSQFERQVLDGRVGVPEREPDETSAAYWRRALTNSTMRENDND